MHLPESVVFINGMMFFYIFSYISGLEAIIINLYLCDRLGIDKTM